MHSNKAMPMLPLFPRNRWHSQETLLQPELLPSKNSRNHKGEGRGEIVAGRPD
ncbi:MAG: hypothetical protein OEL83_19935 [Desulforhopalus sp.]|nr:hypothetical protein [Desulforhopalus sp.]